MPGDLEKARHQCISKIASNSSFISALFAFLALLLSTAFTGVTPAVQLHQDEVASFQLRGDR
uniref:Uncharacterized protein n=1 Tax=Equus asinus TaxID=9793 RepID=A0A9L0K8T0_EQUAS